MRIETPREEEQHTVSSDARSGRAIQMLSNTRNQRKGLLSVLGAVVLWSTSFAAIKVGVADIPPITFAALRFLIAALVMGSLTFVGVRPEPVLPNDFGKVALGGLLGITALFSLHNLGMQRTTSADANLLVASYPVMILLLEILVFKARVNIKQFAGVAIAIGGVYLVIHSTGEQSASHRLAGNLLILAAGWIWAVYNVVTQHVVRRYSTFTVIFWQTVCGMGALVVLSLTEVSQWHAPGMEALFAATFLGVVCSVGAYLLYGYGLKYLQAGLAVNMMNLQPMFGLVFAAMLLGETVSLLQIIGGIILVIGVSLSLRFGLNKR